MTYGFELYDQNGAVVQSSLNLVSITDSRIITRGSATSGNYAVPVSRYVFAIARERGGTPLQVTLSGGGTTVNWSVPANSQYFPQMVSLTCDIISMR